MQKFRPSQEIRTLALATAAALMLVAPAARAEQGSTAASTKSAAEASKHAKHQQDEMNEHVAKLTKELKLTPDQQVKVKDIVQTMWTQKQEFHAKYKDTPSTPEAKLEMEKAHQELHASIEASFAQVLTPEQMTEYKKMNAEHMKKKAAKVEKAEKEVKEAATKTDK